MPRNRAVGLLRRPTSGAVAAGSRYECAALAVKTTPTDGPRLPHFDTTKDLRPSVPSR